MLDIFIAGVFLFTGSVTEVQVNLCESLSSIESKLSLSKWSKKSSEETYFIESSELALYKQSWVFKAKVDKKNKTAEITLKNNVPLSRSLTDEYFQIKNCEYDLHGTAKKIACKLSHKIDLDQFNAYHQSQDYIRLLSREQLAWLNDEKVEIPNNLTMTTQFIDQDYSTTESSLKITLGVTKNTKKQEFIEISTRANSENEIVAQQNLLRYLKNKKVMLCDNQGAIMTELKLKSFFNP